MIEGKGQVVSIANDFINSKVHITVALSGISDETLSEIKKDIEYSVVIKRAVKKRSLNANAYMWVLLDKIAHHPEVLSTKDEVYEEIIQKDAPLFEDENGYITITVKTEVDMTRIAGHWRRCGKSKDGKWISYIMTKGSSEFDTQEMSKFLDLVIEEAKRLGIQTETPEEIARMKEQWGVDIGR